MKTGDISEIPSTCESRCFFLRGVKQGDPALFLPAYSLFSPEYRQMIDEKVFFFLFTLFSGSLFCGILIVFSYPSSRLN